MPLQNTLKSNLSLAIKDLKDGICSIHLWPMLGWQEIKQRYRRSLLGPLWLTISTGVMIGGMGPLYSKLFNQDLSVYFGFLAVSLVIWMLISSLINESCLCFIAAEGFIKQIKLPLTIYILKVIWKNLIIFAHNLLILVVLLLFYPPPLAWQLLLAPLGVLLIAVNAIWLGLLLGLLCARFRDIPQLVSSVMQIAFFLTPIMWKADMLGKNGWMATINPIFHFLEVVRAPLVGSASSVLSWTVVLGTTVVGFAITLAMFARFRSRIAYWL